ncbi:hypothetical protein HZS_6619 [Henneguya salminicola]|nr:hypothetical protein HZS_6619 [Henneguya salminicola]
MIPQRINLLLTLLRSSIINYDSTFMSVPEISYQFFIIHGEYNNVLIPCFFALVERKTEIIYIRVWEKAEETVEITCQTTPCDFEKASINSFIFCNSKNSLKKFYLFFSQCIWRYIQRGE